VSAPIESYALLGDTESCALVGLDGSIDWMCLPRFDSEAVFAALLGDERHGRWLIAPAQPPTATRRAYRPGTLVLETDFETQDGRVRLVDLMPVREHGAGRADVVRIVEGLEGAVPVHSRMGARFDYGSVLPALRREGDEMHVVAGPQALVLRTSAATSIEGGDVVGEATVGAGERLAFVLTSYPSHRPAPPPLDPEAALDRTAGWWREWSARCSYEGPYADAVQRSLITLKALIYAPTGGIVAAPTTSLPEQLGGARNWDYRYCWLRDASLTLMALSRSGYLDEARGFRDWILRAVAGEPAQAQIMYGLRGERRLPELELDWLPGYERSAPVRIGNAAAAQFQLDVYGEVLDTAYAATEAGFPPDGSAVAAVQSLAEFARDSWRDPDEGIWEVRGPRRHFTHSKVMAWVALDRAIKLRDRFAPGTPAPLLEAARAEIHDAVCTRGWNAERGAFVQYLDGDTLDASVLLMPTVGFLPGTDERFVQTVATIERELASGPFVDRYATADGTDGLAGEEGSFLICAFWLVDALALSGRREDAVRNFEQLLAVRNDVGLLAEEYDAGAGRLLGNFPQAFSHLGVVCSAYRLREAERSGR
jgi:GH15 family glucan-1,4-alpha-glucosidase